MQMKELVSQLASYNIFLEKYVAGKRYLCCKGFVHSFRSILAT